MGINRWPAPYKVSNKPVAQAVRSDDSEQVACKWLQAVERLSDEAIGFALLGRWIEQRHRYIGVSEMGDDRHPHDFGAQSDRLTKMLCD